MIISFVYTMKISCHITISIENKDLLISKASVHKQFLRSLSLPASSQFSKDQENWKNIIDWQIHITS